ncbi:TlyA family RNA methyltransferase [Exiguobacterium sp.]|uniref:TlyA family RNA methyltransferase n=1 Tax=Exiguobacterium sp. TaxID=44751 RepID=UPI00263B686D|nr:TlyA family RNA methyltransferase [Exiguobacterium sp.]MCC5893208.1 TlyA family RNA methyltransferase [Exiguobacterium sp.]
MEKRKKTRLDVLLVDRGLAETREKAKRSVMAGLVYSGTERLDKAGDKVFDDIPLEVKGQVIPYVGRGGLKLEKALAVFPLDVTDKVGIDIGSSTGGFTDCALQNGARQMYAVDVGYNQLAWKLRSDERVVVMERVNFRHATADQFAVAPDFATIDVSFISLRLMIPPLKHILKPDGVVMALVKPQFEAGKADVGKKGIVRDRAVHERVVADMVRYFASEGFHVEGLDFSPITGGDGNIEFLLFARFTGVGGVDPALDVSAVIEAAHTQLKKNA